MKALALETNLSVTPVTEIEPESKPAAAGSSKKLSVTSNLSAKGVAIRSGTETTISSSPASKLQSVTTKTSTGSRFRQEAPKKPPLHIRVSRQIVDNKFFTAITAILTIYALCGSDIKTLTTDKPADLYFDVATCFCILVFTAEVILCTFGKDDYLFSFFMCLDVISTFTLVLDVSVIEALILGDEEELKNMRGSRTAKIGARATRLVRVIRLLRIIKLYKAIYEANQAKKRREARAVTPGDDDDDWEDVEVNLKKDQLSRESRVGKKLSELTTRRVIWLVLTMMLMHRLLRVDTSQQFTTSGQYGADLVSQAFQRYISPPAGVTESNASRRTTYENAMLQYVYYHNWYTSMSDECPGDAAVCSLAYDSALYWVGMVSNTEKVVEEKAAEAQMSANEAEAFNAEALQKENSKSDGWIFNYGAMPPSVVETLGKPWEAECNTISMTKRRLGFSLIPEELTFGSVDVTYAAKCPEDLRRSERTKITASLLEESTMQEWHLAFYFDLRKFMVWEAIYSLLITCYICVSLCAASIMFTNDANRLVLYPVENMISKVETIRDNPLSAMKVADDEFKVEEMNRAKARKEQAKEVATWKRVKDTLLCARGDKQPKELMETVILEKTIIKLGSLLALGFGQAGAQIIEHNMHGVDSACVDAMIEGTRVDCIIGATRIRDFSTATEVLQSKVMTFVNQIAEIVHGVVDEFHGYASKNNGDFFLMIWRKTDCMDEAKVSKLADMSMMAFTRILGAVHRSPVLATYRGHPGLQQRLGKNCRVNLSSGLHYGWAIEGAIGSEFKIDASYLSPNVSIAESVERATQIYGVNILVAESVLLTCTAAVAGKCRLIDRVIITGSVQPMELYVIDLDYMRLPVEPPLAMQINWTSRQRFRVRQFLEAEKTAKWHNDYPMVKFFNKHADIASMRFRYTVEFLHVFNMGYQNYSQGEWQVAQRLLSRTRTMLGVIDGPSLALLRFMETPYNFEAPDNWQGIRDLGHASLQ